MSFRDVRLGAVEDIVLDGEARRVLGFVVLCGDGGHRMLPLSACDFEGAAIRVHSALVLMEDAFYRKHCRTLTGLQGEPLERGGENVGHLADVLFDVEGNVERFVLDGVGAGGEVPADERVVLDGGTASSAV